MAHQRHVEPPLFRSDGFQRRTGGAIRRSSRTATAERRMQKEFCMKSQWVSYESNKALYEGWLDHMWNDATGVMLWMSGASYPSMVWQTYDYYYDLTGSVLRMQTSL